MQSALDDLRAQVSGLRKELDALAQTFPTVFEELAKVVNKAIDKRVAAGEARVTLDLEREFGAALARGPTPSRDVEARVARGAEHLARIETRLQRLERG